MTRVRLARMVLASLVCVTAVLSTVPSHARQATVEFFTGETFPSDLQELVVQVEPAYRRFPDEPCVLYQVAAIYAKAGRPERALAALRRMHQAGAGLHPRLGDGFQSLADNAEFLALVERIRTENPPVRNARAAFDLAEADLIPEGIAWSDRTRTLYLGSVKRKIVALGEDGRVRDFVAPATGGLGAVLGVRVDDGRGELWAASAALGRTPPAGIVAGLFRFRLADGRLIRAYPVPGAAGDLVNDVAVAPDGKVYATKTMSGALVRVDPASGRVDEMLRPGTLPDPNGIAVTPDGRHLLVAGWYNVTRVEIATGRTRLLDKEPSMGIGCFDGLYVSAPGELVGVQNCVHDSGRILRVRVDDDYARVRSVEVLESYNPLFEIITTAAVAGRELYFVANTQLRNVGPDGMPAGTFNPLHVLRLPLGDRPTARR